jgi:hypothetical protein
MGTEGNERRWATRTSLAERTGRSRNVFPVPDGPQTTRFSRRCTHSSVRSACWVGTGIELASLCQASKVFPVGNAAAARRVASAES